MEKPVTEDESRRIEEELKGAGFTPERLREKLKAARHRAEIPLTVLAVLITIGTLALISYAAVTARDNEDVMKFLTELTGIEKDFIQFVLRAGGDIALAAILVLLGKIVHQNNTFLGKVLSREMRLSDSRFYDLKEYYRIITDACQMKIVPELFITGADYVSEVMKVPVRSNKVLTLDKKMVLRAEQTGSWDEVDYSLAKRLAKVYLGYYSLPNQVFTFIMKLIPGLSKLFSRCRTYSVDRVVMALLGPDKAFEGVFRECYDVELYRDLDREEIVEGKMRTRSRAEAISKFLENLSSEKPVSPYRLKAMLDTKKDGKLI